MKRLFSLFAVVLASASCESSSHGNPATSVSSGSGAGSKAGPEAGSEAGSKAGTEARSEAGSEAGTVTNQLVDGGPQNGSVPTIAMPRISGGVPAFSSGDLNASSGPSKANDDDPMTSWIPDKVPAWIAYDLSAVPIAERQGALVVWNAPATGNYLNPTVPAGSRLPIDYSLEINAAPGGTAPPGDGWVSVATVTNNLRNTVEHPVMLAGANWVRMSIATSSDATGVALDVDVFSTPNSYSDCWMFMGDSITYITMGYVWSTVPQQVHQLRSDRWPAAINAAIGGTRTIDGVMAFDQTIAGYPGRYVVLAYGTNDHPTEFQMETLVQKVIAAGRVPVVPHMPWSALPEIQTSGPLNNAAIDALYAKYPQIVRGPDLWAAFMNRTDLIPANDVHPNTAGKAFLQQQWAQTMAAIP